MSRFAAENSVGEVVKLQPDLSRLFEEEGIDYCCGGKKSLEEVCREKGINLKSFLSKMEDHVQEERGMSSDDYSSMSLSDLVEHILDKHHSYLRSELPRLDRLTDKVASVHGSKEAGLLKVRETFQKLAAELMNHMAKEEQILFPLVRRLDSEETLPEFHCGSLANPIRQMEFEHDGAGRALESLRDLTHDYRPPEWACNTYRAMLEALARLENDLHEHIHKENNILFPRVRERIG